jgi:hypothetical protein
MTVTPYNFAVEPREDMYKLLLETAREFCSAAILVVRPTVAVSDDARAIQSALGGALVEETPVQEWPGTRLLHSGSVQLFKYEYGELAGQEAVKLV